MIHKTKWSNNKWKKQKWSEQNITSERWNKKENLQKENNETKVKDGKRIGKKMKGRPKNKEEGLKSLKNK